MASRGPLSGVIVLDLTRVLAGPFCTMILADLGARVIKVERPQGGDDARAIGPFIGDRSAYFMSLNRGKESIALDLRRPEDREIFDALLARADVLVENFRAGVLEGLGYGWETLHGRFPALIYAAVSGFGHTGPYARRPAYDMVVQAMGGIMSVTGEAGGPPTRVGTSIGDIGAGLFAATGIQSALFHRSRTGEATKVDVAMLDAQVAILENAIARYLATGVVPEPIGARHPSIAPFARFETADRPIVIAAGNDALFRKLCAALGDPALAEDPRFASNDSRCRHQEELASAIEGRLRDAPAQLWLERLEESEVPCGPINDVAGVLADEQVQARNMVIQTSEPTSGEAPLRMPGNPIKLAAFEDPHERRPAPDLDADRAAILQWLARPVGEREPNSS